MKKVFTFLTFIFCFVLFAGCSKDPVQPTARELNAKYLVGDGNRVWHLNKIYVNSIQQTLTDAQMKYTKTYTINPSQPFTGTFTNSDGYNGEWRMPNELQLNEVIINNPAGAVAVGYDINSILPNSMDIQYTANYKLVREVYYAN